MTETPTTNRGNGRKDRDDETPALTDQLVLSTAGLAGRGVAGVRRAIDGALTTVDTLVVGAFDIADQIVTSNIATDIAAKGLAIGRQSWTNGLETTRTIVGEF